MSWRRCSRGFSGVRLALLVTLLLLLRLPEAADQRRLAPWNLQQSPGNAEHLRYRLAYRGILTAFV